MRAAGAAAGASAGAGVRRAGAARVNVHVRRVVVCSIVVAVIVNTGGGGEEQERVGGCVGHRSEPVAAVRDCVETAAVGNHAGVVSVVAGPRCAGVVAPVGEAGRRGAGPGGRREGHRWNRS